MIYRKEIDGLRAIAVLPVIFFHAGFDFFNGGYVGVDVFFVISGYLITTIILKELNTGQFSIINFYARRARRILPVLFLVMFVSVLLAWYLLVPSDMKDFSKSLIAVPLFSSNMLFWIKSGYFDTASELKPLLHTWSLAVEEQFYIVFPFILLLLWKLNKKIIIYIITILFFVSVAFSELWSSNNPSSAFYLIISRAWELLIGTYVAYYLMSYNGDKVNIWVKELLGYIGLILILYAVFYFDQSSNFPGFNAFVPTIGTALIIAFVDQNTTIGKFLGNKILVTIGLLSYSAYLWHQPIFAFGRHIGLTNYDKIYFIYLIIFTFILASLSYKLVEVPCRKIKLVDKKSIFKYSGLGIIFFVILGIYGYFKNGDIGQLSYEKKSFLNKFENDIPEWKYFENNGILEKFREDCNFYDIEKYRNGLSSNAPRENISKSCFTKENDNYKTIFIWGDSHAQQLNYGLRSTIPSGYDILQVASSGCVAKKILNINKSDYCEYSNYFAFDLIKKIKPDYIIIGQNLGHNYKNMESLYFDLKSLGIKNILFTGPSPHWAPSLPVVAVRFLPNIPQRSWSGIDKVVLELDKKIKKSLKSEIKYISLIDHFCSIEGCLLYYDKFNISESVTSWDYGHLTPLASKDFVNNALIPIIIQK